MCQQKLELQPQKHDEYDFLITYENETSPTTPLIILVFKRIWNVLPLPRETCPQMFELRIYKVVSNIISNFLSVRAQF